MDALGDLVKEACRLIRRGETFAAHAQLHDVATAVRALDPTEATGLATCLYAWLVRISDAAESAALPGGRVDSGAVAEFGEQIPQAVLVDRFEALVTVIFDSAHTPAGSQRALWERTKRYIEANADRPLRIGEIPQRMRCSGSTLRRAWRAMEGKDSPTLTQSRGLQKERVEKAKPRLLATPGASPDEIAAAMGWSRRTLDRDFVRFEGMTMTEWRRRQLRSQGSG